jgi:hypothetical protein
MEPLQPRQDTSASVLHHHKTLRKNHYVRDLEEGGGWTRRRWVGTCVLLTFGGRNRVLRTASSMLRRLLVILSISVILVRLVLGLWGRRCKKGSMLHTLSALQMWQDVEITYP